jgi:hypothetical protein
MLLRTCMCVAEEVCLDPRLLMPADADDATQLSSSSRQQQQHLTACTASDMYLKASTVTAVPGMHLCSGTPDMTGLARARQSVTTHPLRVKSYQASTDYWLRLKHHASNNKTRIYLRFKLAWPSSARR